MARTDPPRRPAPVVIDGISFPALDVGFAWTDPEAAIADAKSHIDRFGQRPGMMPPSANTRLRRSQRGNCRSHAAIRNRAGSPSSPQAASHCPECSAQPRRAAHHPRAAAPNTGPCAARAAAASISTSSSAASQAQPVPSALLLTPASGEANAKRVGNGRHRVRASLPVLPLATGDCRDSPHEFPDMAKSTRTMSRRIRQNSQSPAEPRSPRRQIPRPSARRAADRAGAGGIAQSRDQPRRCRNGLGHRPAAAAGQFLGPPRRRRGRRASRAGLDARDRARMSPSATQRGLDEAPQANYGTSATIPTLDPELARQFGLPTAEDDDEPTGAAAAQQDGSARRQGDRRRAGKSDPRGPPGVPQGRRPAEGVDAAPAAAPGKVRRRRALRDQVRVRSRRATSRPRSPNWSRASTATTARRCCSASPARARPTPWPR